MGCWLTEDMTSRRLASCWGLVGSLDAVTDDAHPGVDVKWTASFLHKKHVLLRGYQRLLGTL